MNKIIFSPFYNQATYSRAEGGGRLNAVTA